MRKSILVMRESVFTALLLAGMGISDMFAQDNGAKKDVPEMNCYLKWAQKFEDRGANDVEDGTYTDVIITFRNGSGANCYNGKAEVKNNIVLAMYIKLEDGSYEIVKRKWKYDVKDVTIQNGISKTQITIDDELINVLFVKKIKPKKKGYEKAPDPSDLN
jgi:hypothetical protein